MIQPLSFRAFVRSRAVRPTIRRSRGSDLSFATTIHTWPFFLRPVTAEFDTVAIRIAQVNRFAHAVIRRPFDGNAVIEQALERPREFSPVRIENREMIKPASAWRRLTRPFAGPGIQANVMMIAAR